LKEIYWYAPVAQNDLLTIVDGAGNIIKQAKCEVAGQSQIFPMYESQVEDLKVTVLGSGVVYIMREV
jgi:hypothetical protein